MNTNQKRRDEIMCFEKPKYTGGLEVFDELSLQQLEVLVAEDFVTEKDKYCSAPQVSEFLALMKKHEGLGVHGYVISTDRNDSRVVIQGVHYYGTPNEAVKADFKALCSQADDYEVEKHSLYSWWQ